jgi:hypothetical protein
MESTEGDRQTGLFMTFFPCAKIKLVHFSINALPLAR